MIQDGLVTENVCNTLAAVAVLQPALKKLLDHLLDYLSRHLKEVLETEVCPTFLLLINCRIIQRRHSGGKHSLQQGPVPTRIPYAM